MSIESRLPPIQYLTAFVAAARCNSFKLAAQELNVTPSAVSQQIKSLEEYVGLSLFIRKTRALELTEEGGYFYRFAERTIRSYEDGYAEFVSRYFSTTLRVSTTPYISNEILIPRLHEFHKKYPELNLIVQASSRIESLDAGNLDAGIRVGIPNWHEYNLQLISEAKSGLVCTAEYLRKHPLNSKSDWQDQTLIHMRSHENDWKRVTSFAESLSQPKKELHFDSYDAGIRAAEEGLGIAIGMFPISNKKVRDKKLVVLADKYIPVEEGFYLVTKRNDKKQHYYELLLDWLKGVFRDS